MLIIKNNWQNLGKYGKCTRWFKMNLMQKVITNCLCQK